MTRSNTSNVRAVAAGPPVAQLEARLQEITAELKSLDVNLKALHERLGDASEDRLPTDKIAAEIAAQLSKQDVLTDQRLAIERRMWRAVADESKESVIRYNQRLGEELKQVGALLERLTAACTEVDAVVAGLMPRLDTVTQLARPYCGLDDFAMLRRLPGSMVTQLALAVCGEDPAGRAAFRQAMPLAPHYEQAQVFKRIGLPLHLLAEATRVLQRPLPDDSAPTPEAA